MSEIVGILRERGVKIRYPEIKEGLDVISRIGGISLGVPATAHLIKKIAGNKCQLLTDNLDFKGLAVAPITLLLTKRPIYYDSKIMAGLADNETGVAIINANNTGDAL